MRRTISVLMLAIPLIAHSQLPSDALRYSQTSISGSARFVSMGGAFGAVGGDFTSCSYNPAGLGVFRSSEFSFTPIFLNRLDESKIRTSVSESNKSQFGLDNLGMVAAFSNSKKDEEGIVSYNFGFGYNKLADFAGESLAQIPNTDNSIMDYLTLRAVGNSWQSMTSGDNYNPYTNGSAPWEAILAWNSFVVDTVEGNYFAPLRIGDGVHQENAILSKGRLGEYVFSFAVNYSNKLYLGATLGVYDVFYKKSLKLTERAFETNLPLDNGDLFQSLNYLQTYEVDGTGYNFKMGAIYRPIPMLRIGLAVHTPTYMGLNESYDASIRSTFNWGNASASTPISKFDYKIDSPFRLMGGVAYTIGNMGLISADVERVDYSLMKLGSDEVGLFTPQNQEIKREFGASHNFRFGGEFWLGPIAIRGGYAFQGSPYKSASRSQSEMAYTIISGGIGYRTSNLFVDLGYQHLAFSDSFYLYNLLNPLGNNISPKVESSNTQSKFLLTMGFRF